MGITAKFWISSVEDCSVLFMMMAAVKTNNFKVFHKCVEEIANIFFAFGGQNYSRFVNVLHHNILHVL